VNQDSQVRLQSGDKVMIILLLKQQLVDFLCQGLLFIGAIKKMQVKSGLGVIIDFFVSQ